MFLAFIALIVIIGLLVSSFYFHMSNMETTYKKVMESSPSSFKNAQNNEVAKMKNLKEMLYTSHGSNFNALAISAWLLIFVAAFYSFFLTPQLSEGLTFLKVPELASFSLGLLLFAGVALLVGFVFIIALKLPRVYGYYILSRRIKKAIMATWLLLWVPIGIPAYLATLYPYPDNLSIWIDVSFVILISSLFILLMPIYLKAIWEPRRA